MRMDGVQFGSILNEDQPLLRGTEAEQGGQQGGLAGTGGAADQKAQLEFEHLFQDFLHEGAEHAGGLQFVQGEDPLPADPDAEQRSSSGHRRQHGMDAVAAGQPYVHAR
jgi:hypothetical protein